MRIAPINIYSRNISPYFGENSKQVSGRTNRAQASDTVTISKELDSITPLMQQISTKLDKYDYKGTEIYHLIADDYKQYLKKELSSGNHKDYGQINSKIDKKYLEHVEETYGQEALQGYIPAICALETLDYMLDKPELTDIFMSHPFKSAHVLLGMFRNISKEHTSPDKVKDAYITRIDYLSSEPGSTIFTNKYVRDEVQKLFDINTEDAPLEDGPDKVITKIEELLKEPNILLKDHRFARKLGIWPNYPRDWMRVQKLRDPSEEELARILAHPKLKEEGYPNSHTFRGNRIVVHDLEDDSILVSAEDGTGGYYLFKLEPSYKVKAPASAAETIKSPEQGNLTNDSYKGENRIVRTFKRIFNL